MPSDSDDDTADDSDYPLEEECQVFNSDVDKAKYLSQCLQEWSLRGVSMKKVDQLLRLLHVLFPQLPLSHKTLLGTSGVAFDIEEICGGEMWYKGVGKSVSEKVSELYLSEHNEVVIDINIDGVKVFNNGSKTFWPILGNLKGTNDPFIIAVYCGDQKPTDWCEFFEKFMSEVEVLMVEGLNLFEKIYSFSIGDYILDAQARAYIKGITHHNGVYACEKCEVKGQHWMGRMIFLNIMARLRSDESFSNRRNPEHHNTDSPLECIGTGMVSQFRLDGMHMVHLGVQKRMVHFLFHDKRKKLHYNQINKINKILEKEVAEHFPSECNRRPRSLGTRQVKGNWKATECRRFVLYDGIFILKNNVDTKTYNHFLLLHVAVYILSSEMYYITYNAIAQVALNQFVEDAREIYGDHFVVYNVHSLVHLPAECLDHGPLDSFSCFKFENYLGLMKNYIRSTYKPLQQLARRDFETKGQLKNPDSGKSTTFGKSRTHEVLEVISGSQVKSFKNNNFIIRLNKKDRCFKTKEGDYIILDNIIKSEVDAVTIAGYKFQTLKDFFKYPMASSKLGIVVGHNLENERRYWHVKDLSQKCFLIPNDKYTYLIVPLIHGTH